MYQFGALPFSFLVRLEATIELDKYVGGRLRYIKLSQV